MAHICQKKTSFDCYHPMSEDKESKIMLIKENGTVFRFLFSQISPVFGKIPILKEMEERRKSNVMSEYANICIDVWGDFAMFTRPDSRVERVTYPVPTPSACRGILNAVYSKPIEFYYEITQIDVMKPIRLMTVRRNEVKKKTNVSKAVKNKGYFINSAEERTQRVCTYIRDVYYRIHAKLVLRDDAPKTMNVERLLAQFNRRVENGKCFYQPALGTRECMCYFSAPDMDMEPIDDSENLGVMLYDVFDIRNNIPLDTSPNGKKTGGKTQVSFFNAVMEHGVIHVPAFDSNEILIRRNQVHV